MKRITTLLTFTFLTFLSIMAQNSIYDFTVKDNKGNDVQRFEPTATKDVIAPAIETLLK